MEASELVHSVSSLCSAPPDHAFAYLTDPHRLGEWSLGCWETRSEDGIVRGTSLFDGAETVVRMIPVPEHRIVDFEVGDDPARLVRRISARVVPGEDVGGGPASSLVVLSACETARGTAESGEGVLGLVHGFQLAAPGTSSGASGRWTTTPRGC